MVKVRRVIDGYTLETESRQEVRLLDVSASEDGKPGVDKAKEELRKLVGRRNVRVEPVGVMYGRIVAKVAYKGQSVNDAMNTFINRAR